MKKQFFFAAVALVALAGCADKEYIGDSPTPTSGNGPEKAIVFNSGTNATTRATWTGEKAADLLNNNFKFFGTKTTTGRQTVFDQYNAYWTENTANTTKSNTNDWEYVGYAPDELSDLPTGATQAIKYWDYAATQYDFAAYSLGKGAGTTPTYAEATRMNFANLGKATTTGDFVYKLTGTVAELKECYISDLVTAYNYDDNTYSANTFGQVVTFSFRSLASKIRLAFYETIPGYSVKDLEFYNVVTKGGTSTITESVNNTPKLLSATDASSLPLQFDATSDPADQVLEVYFPTTGWTNAPENHANDSDPKTEYNKAHVKITPDGTTSNLTFDALEDFANSERQEDADDYLGRASNAATYAGGIDSETGAGKYYTILPNEVGANLMIRVKYKLVSTDGSDEIINVDNATAVIPAELASWKPNYAYTYIFKISDMTNGYTGFDKRNPDNPITGLTPITLNAVVVDSEDGLQETITTVADPSITTYMAGKVVTENNEYITGKNIYVVVNDGSDNKTLTIGTNAKLYTVTNSSTIQSISEESVDNALRYGTIGEGGPKYTASIPAKDTDLSDYYTESNGTYTAATGTADGKTTYYKLVAPSENVKTYTVHDASGQDMVVTESNLLAASTKIEVADSPTGDEVNVVGARFMPTAPGTYVFQYKGKEAGAYGTYAAVAPDKLSNRAAGTYYKVTATEKTLGTTATSGNYYKKEGDNYVEQALPLAAGTYYTLAASAAAGTEDIVNTTRYYTKEEIYLPVTGALTASTSGYYYYDSASSNYVAYTSSATGDDPVRQYYVKGSKWVVVEYKKLTEGDTYYTSNRGAGEFKATGSEVVDAVNKYFTRTNAEVDAEYMYKIIKVQ